MTPEILLDQALQLPPHERAAIALQLLRTLDDAPKALSAEQFEAHVRNVAQQVECSGAETVDAFEVIREIRKRR